MTRPIVNQTIIAAAARLLTTKIEGLKASDSALLADAITEAYSYPMSRNRLIRALETDFGWDCDMFDSDVLGQMDSLVREEHRKACENWVNEQKIRPILKSGDKVLCLSKNIEGVIKAVPEAEAPGCYLITIEDDTTGTDRNITVPFEDVIQL